MVAAQGPQALSGSGAVDPFGVWGPPSPKPVVLAVQGLAYTLSIELALAADVVAAAARRVLRNPDGVKQEAGAIDTWSESRNYGDETQDVYFTAAELRRVTSTAQMSSDFAGSIPYRR